MQLVAPLRELPLVQVNVLNVQPFKRLARLADAHGAPWWHVAPVIHHASAPKL